MKCVRLYHFNDRWYVLFDQFTKNRWDTYLGSLFEQFVRDHATIIAKKFGYTNEIQAIGSYWQHPTKRKKGVQIDIVIEFIDHTTFICECKWKGKRKTGMEAVYELRQKAKLYPNKNNHTVKCIRFMIRLKFKFYPQLIKNVSYACINYTNLTGIKRSNFRCYFVLILMRTTSRIYQRLFLCWCIWPNKIKNNFVHTPPGKFFQ
jgi:Archaea bacterial proteins of unknown function.